MKTEHEILDELTGYIDCGFYIDVGANEPVIASVTKKFYDRGWNGINIEPLQRCYNLLVEQRPRDINLNIACGSENGEIDLYIEDFLNGGLSTVVEKYSNTEWRTTRVQKKTLSEICNQ